MADRWTKQETEILTTMLAKGWSHRDIGVVVKRSTRAVKQKVGEMRKPVVYIRKPYSEDDERQMLEMKLQGVPDEAIAEHFGRTVRQIRDKLCSLRRGQPKAERVPYDRDRKHLVGVPQLSDRYLDIFHQGRQPSDEEEAEVWAEIEIIKRQIIEAKVRHGMLL